MSNNNNNNNTTLLPGYTRIRDSDNFIGTVMYVGPVASAKKVDEIYAGISWDDASRGLHDGSVICRSTKQLVRHFSALKSRFNNNNNNIKGLGCSFMKLNKLDYGVELSCDILKQKYEAEELIADPANNIITGASVMTSSGRAKPIEFVGELKIKKQQQLNLLKEVSLRNCGIVKAGEYSDAYRHLIGLDLSGNLIYQWKEVFRLLVQFPALEELNLTANRILDLMILSEGDDDALSHEDEISLTNILSSPSQHPPKIIISDYLQQSPYYISMRQIILNRCDIKSFQTVQLLDRYMPNLEEICVAGNDFSDLSSILPRLDNYSNDSCLKPDSPLEGFHNLLSLDLTDCLIDNWKDQVERLRLIPKLKTLVLNDNPITEIEPVLDYSGSFSSLEALYLVGTKIDLWEHIDSLNTFPALTSLCFRSAPLVENMGASEARYILVARLAKLNILNSSPLKHKERIEAERRYVRTVGRELLAVSTNDNLRDSEKEEKQQQLLMHNPRFEELMNTHKDSMLGLDTQSSGNGSLSNDLVSVEIQSMAASSCTMEPIQKKLPTSLKVGRLKSLCFKAFGVSVSEQRLHFLAPHQGDSFPIELEDDDYNIGYYGVTNKCKIMVNEISDTASSKEKELAKQKQLQLENMIKEQERRGDILREAQRQEVQTNNLAASIAGAKPL